MRLWLFLLVLIFSAGFGVMIRQDPGYALFAYGNWTVEMPLWLSLMFMILTVFFFLLVSWAIHVTVSSSQKVKLWWKNHQEHTARTQTYRGLLELTEGRWQNAERYLTQSAKHSENPLLNYLSAAKAAEEIGAFDRRDHYLDLAFAANTNSTVAVRLTQAQLQLKHGEFKQGVHNLEELHQETPKHPEVLRLLSALYEKTNDWDSLLKLLPSLEKNEVFPKGTLKALEQRLYPALLISHAEQGLKSLFSSWKKIPNAFKNDPSVVHAYAKLLIHNAANDDAEAILKQTLTKTWDEDLITLYGLANPKNAKKQLAFIESFLPDRPAEPRLLLSAGRICLRNQLWGRARDYLEKSLSLQPQPETYAELGQLMEQLAQSDKQNECFRKGLLLATKVLEKSENERPLVCVSYEERT